MLLLHTVLYLLSIVRMFFDFIIVIERSIATIAVLCIIVVLLIHLLLVSFQITSFLILIMLDTLIIK